MAQGEPCDLYLMDSSMTDDDNVELRRQMRAVRWADSFLFFSAVAYDADKRRGD